MVNQPSELRQAFSPPMTVGFQQHSRGAEDGPYISNPGIRFFIGLSFSEIKDFTAHFHVYVFDLATLNL